MYNLNMSQRALSDLEFQAWSSFHALRNSLLPHLAKKLFENSGLTEAEYQVLIGIKSSKEQGIKSKDLSKFLGWDTTRLSHQIARMEEKKLIQKVNCAQDARSFYIKLSNKGKKIIDEVLPTQMFEVKKYFANALEENDLKNLIKISNSIISNLKDES